MNNKIRIGLNKFTFLLVFIYLIVGIGVTYAYFAFNYENTATIVGNVVNVDATLTVERVVGTDEKLVPMMDAALNNAINAVGTTNGACIDSLGNLSCQVYKITLTNNASRLQHLVGSIELYPKEGTNSAYSNLKWQELSSTNQVKDGSIVNGMEESILVSGLTMESKETKTWYVGVWLSEIESDQKDIDKGEFQGTVIFEVNESLTEGGSGGEIVQTPFITNVMGANPINDASLDFSKTSEESGTNGIYVRNDTINALYPIYYYRGTVDNNLIFAEFCWKIVRTTETGGLKLIYNGSPTDGQCNNTGEATQIGTKAFNSSYNSPAYIGYMYGDVYSYTSKSSLNSDTTEYIYGNDVSYANGTYTLIDTTSGAWSNVYSSGLNNYHYTCFTTGTTCTSVYYVYYTTSSTAYYITLNGEANIEVALSNMLDKNSTSSTIKGSATTSGTLDYWYYNNIEQKGYEDYIEDTVWCNDRSIYSLGGWNPDGGTTSSNYYLYFGAYNRVYNTYTPDLTCARDIDKFTADEKNGNGDLDYSVGLLTADEIMLAGGKYGSLDSSYYLYSGQSYWSGSPCYFGNNGVFEFYVYSAGNLTNIYVSVTYGVRPSLSLKPGFSIVGDGTGSIEKPYVVG